MASSDHIGYNTVVDTQEYEDFVSKFWELDSDEPQVVDVQGQLIQNISFWKEVSVTCPTSYALRMATACH